MATRQRQQAYLMFAIAAVVVVGVLVANLQLSRVEKPDAKGCRTKIDRDLVIVIDRTDKVATQTRAEILTRAMGAVRDLAKPGDRVSVFTVNALSRKNLAPDFVRCKPQSEGNPLYENPAALKRYYEANFEEPLASTLSTEISAAEESPIAEALIDLSRTEYLRAPRGAYLLVFSDLMQNSNAMSVYRCADGEAAVRRWRETRAAATQRPSFRNVWTTLNIVPRDGVASTTVTCRDYYWNWFFGDTKNDNALSPGTAALVPDPLPG